MINPSENKYLLWTNDGQLLWISYSVESSPAVVGDSESAVFVLHSKDESFHLSPEDGNILTLSSFENFSVCGDEIVDDDVDAFDILKVEDRVKVFDAILAPSEKKTKAKAKYVACMILYS